MLFKISATLMIACVVLFFTTMFLKDMLNLISDKTFYRVVKCIGSAFLIAGILLAGEMLIHVWG